ncbi:MAG: acetyltransferase [Bacteroidota bacterium]
MNMRKVLIYGAGGQGRVVLDILRSARTVDILGFVDSNPALVGRTVDGIKVLGTMADVTEIKARYPEIAAVVAIGDNYDRAHIAEQLEQFGVAFVNAVHPHTSISATACIAGNVTIAAGAIVCAHARIGQNVIVNSGAIVEHECLVEENVHLAPGTKLAGRVTVRRNTFVGIGATIIGHLVVGADAIVGAGAVVIKPVEPGTVVAGVPAKYIKPAPHASGSH